MKIGDAKRTIIVEPITEPVPGKEHPPAPVEPDPVREPEPVKTPA